MTQKSKSGPYRPEVILKPSFISAVVTSVTGNFDLPTGTYDLYVHGTHNNTDDTLKLEVYLNEAQSATAPIPIALYNAAEATATLTLAANVYVSAHAYKAASGTLVEAGNIPIPHGVKWTYTKGSATLVNLSLYALRKY